MINTIFHINVKGMEIYVNILSFIAVVAFTITLIEGLFILYIDFKSRGNQLFFLICLAISIWLVGGAFGYSAETSDDAMFWLTMSSPGFIFMHAFVLHFVLRYTGFIMSSPVSLLLYLPSLCFLYLSMAGQQVFSDIFRSGDFWVMVPDYQSLPFYLLMANYLTYYFIALTLLYVSMKRTKSTRVRSQSRIIFIAIIITITSYNVEPFLAPLFFDYLTYGQAPLYSIVWVSLIWYAMNKYRFLGVYERFISTDVLDSLYEMVIIIDNSKRVIETNSALRKKLGISRKPASLHEIFVEYDLVERLLDSIEANPLQDIALNLVLPEGRTGLVNSTLSVFRDRFQDAAGFIIIAQEITGMYSLFRERGITEREYQLIRLVLAGNSNKKIAKNLNISLRTVETHITNIYGKLGLKRRGELINFCTELLAGPAN